MASVGETIKYFRKEKGYSVRYLAETSGISRSTISRWENNHLNPTSDNLTKIFEALGITAKQFWEKMPGWVITEADKKKDIRYQIDRITRDLHDIQIAINILRENGGITISEFHNVETVKKVVLTKGIDRAAEAQKAAEALHLTADDLKSLGVIDEIIEEPTGGAHRAKTETIAAVGEALFKHLTEIMKMDRDRIHRDREEKFMKMTRLQS